MSYCVNCGVELDDTAQACPLCHTPVLNPNKPVDMWGPKPFPTEKGEVPPVSQWELSLLISAMLLSVSVCCGVLNLFLRPGRAWSLLAPATQAQRSGPPPHRRRNCPLVWLPPATGHRLHDL